MTDNEKVDAALQAMWDAMPPPEWIQVIEPITVDGKTIEPGFYVRDAKGEWSRRADEMHS